MGKYLNIAIGLAAGAAVLAGPSIKYDSRSVESPLEVACSTQSSKPTRPVSIASNEIYNQADCDTVKPETSQQTQPSLLARLDVGFNEAYAGANYPCDTSRIDQTTRWTPEKFKRDVVYSGKTSLVHWRIEKSVIKENDLADSFMCDLIERYGDDIDKFILIDIGNYSQNGKDLRNIMAKNQKEGIVSRVPAFSLIYPNSNETRIRGPPRTDLEKFNTYFPFLDKKFK
ncbi:hypothetical protein ISS07_05465 [Candidatus Woesearchaeota archaeon]|nr:hypothetical protein [Candidatus Woesearchaeota archaeon]